MWLYIRSSRIRYPDHGYAATMALITLQSVFYAFAATIAYIVWKIIYRLYFHTPVPAVRSADGGTYHRGGHGVARLFYPCAGWSYQGLGAETGWLKAVEDRNVDPFYTRTLERTNAEYAIDYWSASSARQHVPSSPQSRKVTISHAMLCSKSDENSWLCFLNDAE